MKTGKPKPNYCRHLILKKMKKIIQCSLTVLFLFTVSVFLQAQSQDEQILKIDSILFNDLSSDVILEKKDSCTIFIKIVHDGWYIAKYEIKYSEDGVEKKIERSSKTKGYSETFNFPCTVKNINLAGWAATGLVWEPWGEIYNKTLDSSNWNKCYKNTGTMLNRNWNNECEN